MTTGREPAARAVDVVVIGAGAAGLMCAMTAGGRGRSVLLVDRSNKPGKKILMSGGGRCNFTNMYAQPDNYASRNEHFCKSALARYTPWDFLGLIHKHGIAHHEKKLGQLFCDHKAKDVLNMLLAECRDAGVELHVDTAVQEIERRDGGYDLRTDLGPVRAASVVIATGGLSIPTLGSSGYGYEVARRFGHEVLPTRAGLVPFIITDGLKELCVELTGTAFPAVVTCAGQRFDENVLFTHRGLSGPAILQISSFWELGDRVVIDMLPDRDARAWLHERRRERPDAGLRTVLGEVFTKKMAGLLADRWFTSRPMKQHTPAELDAVAARLAAWEVVPAGTEGYRTAEVTIGGVDTREISPKTMESRRSPGLFFVGEVLDVTGHLGGYNFQWAWASGHAAAQVV